MEGARAAALEAIGAGVVVLDGDWVVQAATAEAERILGGPCAGRPLFDVVRLRSSRRNPHPLAPVALAAVIADGAPYRVADGVVVRADGSELPATFGLVRAEDGLVLALRDLSEVREAEVASRASAVEEEASQRVDHARSRFLANMSHELRTPLNAIIGYSEMLEEDLEDLEEGRLVEDVRKVHRAGQHLLTVINDILDLSRIDAGRMELYTERFDVGALVEEAVAAVAPLAAENGNTVEIALSAGLGAIDADRGRVRQALFNLLSNAAKFTSDGRIRVEAERTGSFVDLRVVDTGIGIAREQLARIFDEFVQADTSSTRRYGGTGLGLALTRRFAQMMGGTIHVESEVGEGSTFSLRLPHNTPDGRPEPEPEPVSAGPVVLVVDDDPTVHELVERALARDGFRVVGTRDPRRVPSLAGALEPCAIVLDVVMPELDGWSVLAALKDDDRLAHIPVVMLSMVDDRSLGFSLGATDYLTKPLDRNRLLGVVRRCRDGVPGGTVLLVEDDEALRELVRRTLQREGWEVLEAADGQQGLDAVEAGRPDVVLLDLMMPVLDGFGFLAQLRSDPAHADLPVVVLTAKTLSERERERLDAATQRVLQKGAWSRGRLLEELRARILAASRSRDAS